MAASAGFPSFLPSFFFSFSLSKQNDKSDSLPSAHYYFKVATATSCSIPPASRRLPPSKTKSPTVYKERIFVPSKFHFPPPPINMETMFCYVQVQKPNKMEQCPQNEHQVNVSPGTGQGASLTRRHGSRRAVSFVCKESEVNGEDTRHKYLPETSNTAIYLRTNETPTRRRRVGRREADVGAHSLLPPPPHSNARTCHEIRLAGCGVGRGHGRWSFTD